MRSRTCSILRASAVCALLFWGCLPCLHAQISGPLSIEPLERVSVKRGQEITARIAAHLRAGFHVNSNAPAEDWLIPLKLTWANGPLSVEQVIYPKPQTEKAEFSTKPLLVFNGNFEIQTRFRAGAALGLTTVNGKLRYQACNSRECLPPKTIEVQLPVNVE